MSATKTVSNIAAPTQFLQVKNERYAYRRFGKGSGHPLLFLQHFTGTLDNWIPPSLTRWHRGEKSFCSKAQG